MPKPLVPILEQGTFEGTSPAGYPGPTYNPKSLPTPTLYQVLEMQGRVVLRPHPPSRMLAYAPAIFLIFFGALFAILPWIIERKFQAIPAIFGVAVAASGPYAGRALYRRQSSAQALGPVLEWDTLSPVVWLPRFGGEVPRADVLAVEHVSMDVPERSSDDATLRAVVLVVRDGEGRVGHRELVTDIANGRFVAEDLCRCFGVGLHVVRLNHAAQR